MNAFTVKILRAHSEPGLRYSNFYIFIAHVRYLQMKISSEFMNDWIELIELHQKKGVLHLKTIFRKSEFGVDFYVYLKRMEF